MYQSLCIHIVNYVDVNGVNISVPGQPEQEKIPPLPLPALPDVVQDGVEVHSTHVGAAC